MTMKLYAVAACARKTKKEVGALVTNIEERIEVMPLYRLARSEEEAVGIVISDIRATLSSSDGWYDHSASAIEIPDHIRNSSS